MIARWLHRRRTRLALTRLVTAHAAAGTFSGAVLVARAGRTLIRLAAGLADRDLAIPNTPETRFRIGSVAKPLTALAVLRLADQHRLSIDDPLDRYQPAFPRSDRILLRHLLSNTSGIPDYLMCERFHPHAHEAHTPAQLVSYVRDLPSRGEPGAALSYSNTNWVLLSQVVEAVTGTGFGTALEQLVLGPAGMVSTSLETTGLTGPAARGYTTASDGVVPAPIIHMSAEVGAGGIRSTVDDLLRLDRALREPGLLQAATLARMKTPVRVDGPLAYGLGLFVGDRLGRRAHGHSGGTFGFSAFWTHYEDQDTTVIVLSNLDTGSGERLERDLAAVTFDMPVEMPAEPRFIVLPGTAMAPFAGRYRSTFAGRTVDFHVELDGEQLVAKFPFLPSAQLRPITPRRFFTRLKGGDVTFEFLTDGERVSGIAVDWSGNPMHCPRLE